MREHLIDCLIEGSKPGSDIQFIINKCTVIYITNRLHDSGLSREIQVELLSRLIEKLK